MLTLDHATPTTETTPICGTARVCPLITAGSDLPICPQSGTTVCPSDTRKQETCPAC